MEMCFHGNWVSWRINHSIINLYSKYQPPSFICSSIMLAPVISSLDEIYCSKFRLYRRSNNISAVSSFWYYCVFLSQFIFRFFPLKERQKSNYIPRRIAPAWCEKCTLHKWIWQIPLPCIFLQASFASLFFSVFFFLFVFSCFFFSWFCFLSCFNPPFLHLFLSFHWYLMPSSSY